MVASLSLASSPRAHRKARTRPSEGEGGTRAAEIGERPRRRGGGAMGGCYSVIVASKMLQMQLRRTAATILTVPSSDDLGRSSPDNKSRTGAVVDSKKKRKGKLRRSGPILGDADQCGPSGECFAKRFRLGAELGRGEFGMTRLRRRAYTEDVRREVDILRLHEACEDAKGVHLVMELCEGGELCDRIFARKTEE